LPHRQLPGKVREHPAGPELALRLSIQVIYSPACAIDLARLATT
jgi:hypothetical protein